jgi:ribosomal protein S27E
MAWFRKEKAPADDVINCEGCGRTLSVATFNMRDGPSPGTAPNKIHKTVDRNQPWYKVFCPNCGHWTIRVPL